MSIVVQDWRISVQIVEPHFYRLKRPDSALNAVLHGVESNKLQWMDNEVLLNGSLERRLITL